MGFFDGISKMIKGQPMYDNSQQDDGWSSSSKKSVKSANQEESYHWGDETVEPTQKPAAPDIQKQGPKVIPKIGIIHSHFRENGLNMDVYATVKNMSQGVIWLDKIRMIKSVRELDDDLLPGQEHEYRMYSGIRPNNIHEDEAHLIFKDATGDYFDAIHFIEYKIQSDKNYVVTEFKPHYIKDV